MSKEIYPNITWAGESSKVFTGDQWQLGGASMIRHFEGALRLAEAEIKAGGDPLQRLQVIRDWLTKVMYSCNMENFKK